MNCPVCLKNMSEENFGGVKIDTCQSGCQGLWFDWLELEKLDESHEGFGKALSSALNSKHEKNSNRGQIKCPKCQQLMVAHLYKSAKLVTVDECYECGGFFLDSGELKTIRENFMSEEDRSDYLKGIVEERISQGEIDITSETEQHRQKAAEKFVNMMQSHSKAQ